MKHIITFILMLVVITTEAQKAEKWPKSHFTERCGHGRPKIGEDTTRLDIEDVMALLSEQRKCCCLDVFKYVQLFPYQSGMVAYTADSLIVSNSNGNGELIDSTISRLAQYERSWVNIHIDGNPDRHVIMLVHPGSMVIVGSEYHFGINIIRQQGPSFVEGEFVCLEADHAGALIKPANFIPITGTEVMQPVTGDIEMTDGTGMYSNLSAYDAGTFYQAQQILTYANNGNIPESGRVSVRAEKVECQVTDFVDEAYSKMSKDTILIFVNNGSTQTTIRQTADQMQLMSDDPGTSATAISLSNAQASMFSTDNMYGTFWSVTPGFMDASGLIYGIRYGTDYSANYVDRSLVDYGYIKAWFGNGFPATSSDHIGREYRDMTNNKWYKGDGSGGWDLMN